MTAGGANIDMDGLTVGVDIGMNRIALAVPELAYADSIDLGKRKRNGRRDVELRQLQGWLATWLTPGAVLWIDRPLFQGTGTSAGERLTETASAIMTALPWYIEPVEIHSSSWKSKVLGNHLASKDEIQSWLEINRPDLAQACQTEDEFDAMVIGLYGQGRASGEILAPVKPKPKKRAARGSRRASGL